jgi:tetratricopeptide (TPR) repeat protein
VTVEQAYDLMGRAAELPYGQARTIMVEEALRLAEAAADERLAYRIRNHLRTEYTQSGERAKAFTVFVRCLSDYDRNPELGEEYQLFWGFKSTVTGLTKFPEIPLDRTLAVLDDMERRYSLAGEGLQPVYMCRAIVTQHVHGAEAAEEWYTRWHAAPRTRLSDCEGCDPSAKVSYLAARGRDEDAIALAEPLLRGELGCDEQPQTILTELLPVYLRTGRLDAAVDAHRRAYRAQRDRLAELWAMAVHLEFCARTGNEARGLELLERHLGWLDRAPTPYEGMRFAAAGALLLRRLAEIGHGDVTVRRPAHGDRPAAELPAAELRAELTRNALGVAARFDARNGTPEQGRLVQVLLEAEPLVDRLPLTPYARRAATPPPAPAPQDDLGGIDDVDRLLDLADEHWTRRESTAALAAWRRVDAIAGELSPVQQGRRVDGEGLERLIAGDTQGAADRWRRSAELYARAGDEQRARSATSRYASLLCQLGQVESGLPLLESAFAWLNAHGADPRRVLAACARLAAAYGEAGRTDHALALLGDVPTPEDPDELGDLEMTRARILGAAGRDAELTTALRQAVHGYRRSGQRAALAEAALLLGRRLTTGSAEEVAEADGLLTEAVTNAPADMPALRAAAYAARGGRLLARGDAGQAAEDLIEAVAGFTAEGAHHQAAYARQDLCVAYLETGRYFEAAETAEEALPTFEAHDDMIGAGRTRYLLGHAQRELGEVDAAAETFARLAEDERAEQPAVAARLLTQAGDLLSRLDKDATAAERFAAAAEASRAAGDPYGTVQALRRQALCVMWSGSAEDGLAVMASARAGLAALPGDEPAALTWETALIDFDEARILGALERFGEAVAAVERAAEAFIALDQKDPAEAAENLRADLIAASVGDASGSG